MKENKKHQFHNNMSYYNVSVITGILLHDCQATYKHTVNLSTKKRKNQLTSKNLAHFLPFLSSLHDSVAFARS